ncbi:hypothetical protein EYS14_15135 [Alteromonadaceae bacterium M269]|nr:hypothetical protein EYS14_15135 [Alteromonadaceae bacterium M269]
MNENVQSAYISIALTSIAKQDPIAAYEHFLQHSNQKAGIANRNQAILTGSLLVIFENLAKQDSALAIE